MGILWIFCFIFCDCANTDNNMRLIVWNSHPANPLSSSPQPSTWRVAFKARSVFSKWKTKETLRNLRESEGPSDKTWKAEVAAPQRKSDGKNP